MSLYLYVILSNTKYTRHGNLNPYFPTFNVALDREVKQETLINSPPVLIFDDDPAMFFYRIELLVLFFNVEKTLNIFSIDLNSFTLFQVCSFTHIQFLQYLQDGTPTSKTFEHIPSEMGAEEAEEVGVEHLLRYQLITRALSV